MKKGKTTKTVTLKNWRPRLVPQSTMKARRGLRNSGKKEEMKTAKKRRRRTSGSKKTSKITI